MAEDESSDLIFGEMAVLWKFKIHLRFSNLYKTLILIPSIFLLKVVLGMVEDESTDLFFGEKAVIEGIGPQTRDQYLRTLIRNTYNYHMNEIFATVQNEYTDWSLQVSLLELKG